LIVTAHAQAYVNHGRWIADCPRPHCGNALALNPKQSVFHCAGKGGCQLIAEVDWPVEVDLIDAAISARPVRTTRNWAPAGHRQAIACGFPEGQTAADLVAETHKYQEV